MASSPYSLLQPITPMSSGVAVQTYTDQGSPNSAPIRLLDQKHPEYMLKIDAWLDLTLLKQTGVWIKNSAERLLQKRPREDPEVFKGREEGFTHQPILGTALGWYEAAMFQDDPQFFFYADNQGKELPGPQADYYKKDFLENCDGNNTKFIDFSKKMFGDILTYGAAHVLTDLPARGASEFVLTRQEEMDKGYNKPFLVSYNPTELINWKCDRTGAYDWVVIKTTRIDQEFLQPPETIDTWYYFDRQEFRVYEDRRTTDVAVRVVGPAENRYAKLINQGRHALADVRRVPLRTLYLSNKLWLSNRAYLLLKDHLNQDNSLRWALFMSNLAIPVIIGDVDVSNMTESEVGYLQFPQGTEYRWSEPDGKSFQISSMRLESLREEAFRCMYLQSQGMSMRATPQMQSGRSKIVSMVPTHEVLSGMGNDFRQRLQEILYDVKDARREPEVAPDVRGFEYEDDMTTEEVFAVTSLLAMRIPSAKFERWIYKKIIKAWARDANAQALDDMYKEVDAGPTMDERLDEDLKNRMKLTKAGMEKALTMKLGGGGGNMPPGRGGAGSPPTPTDNTDSSAATL